MTQKLLRQMKTFRIQYSEDLILKNPKSQEITTV